MIDWFKNKSVSIVGNSLSLFDRDYGRLIDSADVVIRINQGYTVRSFNSHGDKTDIIAYSRWSVVGKTLRSRNDLLNTKQFMHVSNRGRNEITDYGVLGVTPDRFFYYPLKMHTELKHNKLNLGKKEKPSTGICILDYLSSCNPKSVSIFGFDWKETPTFYDLHRSPEQEPHVYELERSYCLENFVKKLGYKYYK